MFVITTTLSAALFYFCHSRVVSGSDLLGNFFAGYDKAVRPDFGMCVCAMDLTVISNSPEFSLQF